MLKDYWEIACFLIGQTFAAVWWASALSSDVKYIKKSFQKLEKEVDEKFTHSQAKDLEKKINILEQRLYDKAVHNFKS